MERRRSVAPTLDSQQVVAEKSSRTLQAFEERLYRETEVAVCPMLEALICESIQLRQSANACVRVTERYRASDVVRDDLLDPLLAKFLMHSVNALQVCRFMDLPGSQLQSGCGG